jgi:hypothetical protein
LGPRRPTTDSRERGVGGELDEIFGVVAAQLGLVDGQRARDRFDLAQRNAIGIAEALVDAAGERERPAAVKDAALDRNFEFGGGAMLGGGLGAEFVVPVGSELRAPEPGRA